MPFNKSDNQSSASPKLNIRLLPPFIIVSLLWLVAMLTMTWFSGRPADVSTDQSHAVDEVICRIIIKDFRTLALAVREQYIMMIDHIVRKTTHFSEYAFLGMLSFLEFRLFAGLFRLNIRLKKYHYALGAFIWGVLFAISDEIHQRFVPGRYASPVDVLIDSAGTLTGTAICLLLYIIISKIKVHKKTQKR